MSERDLTEAEERVLSGLPSRADRQDDTTGPRRPDDAELAEALDLIEETRAGPDAPSREEIDEALRLADDLDRGVHRA